MLNDSWGGVQKWKSALAAAVVAVVVVVVLPRVDWASPAQRVRESEAASEREGSVVVVYGCLPVPGFSCADRRRRIVGRRAYKEQTTEVGTTRGAWMCEWGGGREERARGIGGGGGLSEKCEWPKYRFDLASVCTWWRDGWGRGR